jgi:hypothetical protein
MSYYGIELESEEFNKCKNDIVYFIQNYCAIIPTEDQIKLLKNNRNLTRKRRATGFTLIMALKYLHTIIFDTDKTLMWLSHKNIVPAKSTILSLLRDCEFPHKPVPIDVSTHYVKFDNGNRLYVNVVSSCAVRGFRLDALILDEFDMVPEEVAHDFLISVFPCIASSKEFTFNISFGNVPYPIYKMRNTILKSFEDIEMYTELRNDRSY